MGRPTDYVSAAILPWQQALWARLRDGLAANRLGHALMLSGPPGIGKQRLARVLAQTLLCAGGNPNDGACGQCPGCRQFHAGTHPDYLELAPEGAGRTIPIDAVRGFSRRLHLTSQYRHGQVGLIQDAERLTPAASNSLLKTLEEPPAESYLLLVANRSQGLPATIRSRCQIIRFPRPQGSEVKQWLVEQGIAESLAPHLLHAPLLAADRIEDGFMARRQNWAESLLNLAQGRDDPVNLAEAWLKSPLVDFLEWLYGWVVDLMRLRAGLGPAQLTNSDNATKLMKFISTADDQALARFADGTVRARALAETQVNPQLLLESLLVQWSGLCRNRNGATGP